MRWVGHVACIGRGTKVYTYAVSAGSPKEREHSEDGGVDGRMGSKRMFQRLDARVWSRFTWLRIGTDGGHMRTR
jgi:hypothetical protein